jgi:hypothetical protein
MNAVVWHAVRDIRLEAVQPSGVSRAGHNG